MTIEKKIKPPTLKELKERKCSLSEVQAALVQLIELHNKMIADGHIKSAQEISRDRVYGL